MHNCVRCGVGYDAVFNHVCDVVFTEESIDYRL